MNDNQALAAAITSMAHHKRDHAGMSDVELAAWVVTTCLMFGASVATAYQVAGLFVDSLRGKREDAK